ncbi:hypothetical protein Lal_00033362 [Lupinus albus]|nr:hypothetical protein Lal_00033362 [Lupinus albus]
MRALVKKITSSSPFSQARNSRSSENQSVVPRLTEFHHVPIIKLLGGGIFSFERERARLSENPTLILKLEAVSVELEKCQEPNPILTEETSSCKLFLDISSTRVVGVGVVHNTPDAMLHNAHIPPNHVMVVIDIAIENDALLQIPLDEDIITLEGAIGTYVAWPIHLVDVVPTTGKGIAEHSATIPPRVEHTSKKDKVVKSNVKENKPRSKSSYKES